MPKTIILDSNDAADYTVKVRESVLADESVSVAPHDDMDTVDGVNFSMAESSGKKVDAVATAVQNDTVWSSAEITADGTTKPGSISAEGITAGSWEGNLTFDINMNGSGSGGTGGGTEEPDNPDNPDETHKHTYVDGVCSECGDETSTASMPTFSNLRSGGTYPVGTSITCLEGTTLAIDGNETQTDENGVYVFNEVGEYSVLVDYGTSTVNVASAKALNVKCAARDYTPAGATVEMDIKIVENPSINISDFVNNGTYPEGTKVAVDEGGSLKANDAETNTEGGSYTIPGTGDYKIEVTDGQGNVYIVNITVNNISMGDITYPDSPVTQEAGLYTASGTMLASWSVLTDDFDWDVSTDLYEESKLNAIIDNKAINPTGANVKLVLSDTVTKIGRCAFWKYSKLSDIIIPNSVTSIGERAFTNCTGLTKIVIPDSVTSYGQNATFSYCSNLVSVKLSNNATRLANEMFGKCSSLKNIQIPSCVDGTGVNDNAIGYLTSTFDNCSSLEPIDLSDTKITTISSCFNHCSSLKEVKLPKSLETIEVYSFWGCESLSNITIPSTVTKFGVGAFKGCPNLLNLNIPEGASEISSDAFEGVPHITYNGIATGSPWGALSMN